MRGLLSKVKTIVQAELAKAAGKFWLGFYIGLDWLEKRENDARKSARNY
jgi:hypothetical protein